AVFLSLMVGACLALICQTYNIPGDAGSFTLTWMLLILPLVYFMEATLPAAIYLIGIMCWASFYADDPIRSICFWPLAALVVPHFIWSLRREIYTLRSAILAFVMAIGVCVGAGVSLGKTWPGAWMIIFPSIFSILYFLGSSKFEGIHTNWQHSLRFIGGLGIFSLAYSFSFKETWQSLLDTRYFYSRGKITDLSAIPDHLFTFIIIVSAALFFYNYAKRNIDKKALFGLMPLLAIVCYSLGGKSALFSMALFNLYLFGMSIYWIISGVRNNRLKTVNIGMLMLALLIIGRFFDSEVGFVVRGIAFILVGTGFLVANAMLIRQRGGKSE
ncbi:MAG: hypothetical protein PHN59_00720, partial [Candidatus Omnitrophica bacterium]|nr:hypothetical protein [Candidatus Omnitrophota bacterium]